MYHYSDEAGFPTERLRRIADQECCNLHSWPALQPNVLDLKFLGACHMLLVFYFDLNNMNQIQSIVRYING